MLRQLNLIMALINDPPILFLDEPTVGLDPRVRRTTWKFLNSLKKSDKTIILTTHYIEEAEALCDRVGIIDYGKLVAIGPPKELIETYIWNFGDGIVGENQDTVTHEYQEAKVYKVTLRVIDTNGLWSEVSTTINILNMFTNHTINYMKIQTLVPIL